MPEAADPISYISENMMMNYAGQSVILEAQIRLATSRSAGDMFQVGVNITMRS